MGSLYQRKLKEGSQVRIEELTEELKIQANKHAEEKAVWKKAREEWLDEKKRLGTWKVRCLDSENKLKGMIEELEAEYDEVKEKNGGLELELEDLKGCIINGFQKCLRQAAFFYKDIDVSDSRFDVN